MSRLKCLLAMDGEERYHALYGHRWSFVEWLAASRSYMRHMPAWKFWPLAVAKWPGFNRMQRQDERRKAAA